MQNAPKEHSAMLSTIKLIFVLKTFVLSIFEWPLKTGFAVERKKIDPGTFLSCTFRLYGPVHEICTKSLQTPNLTYQV